MAKRLSLRPLKRDRKFEIELNPGVHYILWISGAPKGKRFERFMSVVQAVHRPHNLGDEIHNPVLFRKVVALANNRDSQEFKAKWCYRQAQKFMYWTLEGALRQCGNRCQLRLRGSTCGWPPPEWQNLEPPANGEEGLPEWRLAARDLAAYWIGYWNDPPAQ